MTIEFKKIVFSWGKSCAITANEVKSFGSVPSGQIQCDGLSRVGCSIKILSYIFHESLSTFTGFSSNGKRNKFCRITVDRGNGSVSLRNSGLTETEQNKQDGEKDN